MRSVLNCGVRRRAPPAPTQARRASCETRLAAEEGESSLGGAHDRGELLGELERGAFEPSMTAVEQA